MDFEDIDDRRKELALFRHAVIAELDIEELPRGELSARISELAGRTLSLPSGKQRRFTARTLWTWWSRYKRDGLRGLVPTPRVDKGQPKAFDAKMLETAIACHLSTNDGRYQHRGHHVHRQRCRPDAGSMRSDQEYAHRLRRRYPRRLG